MTAIREYMEQEVAEGGSGLITATLKDAAGAAVTLAQLGTLQLWLYDDSTKAAINAKVGTDIKNANGGTVHATSGLLTLTLAPADNPLVTAGKLAEWHVAFVKWTYDGGAGVGEKEIVFKVVNLTKVP
jgi:hypothetical protein